MERREKPRANPPRHFACRDPAEIPAIDARSFLFEGSAAAKHKILPGKHAAFRMRAQMIGECVQHPALVARNHLTRNGNIFRFSRGRSRGERKVGNRPRPAEIFQYRKRAAPIFAPKIFVMPERDTPLERCYIGNICKPVFLAELGMACTSQEPQQYKPLRLLRIVMRKLFEAMAGEKTKKRGCVKHRAGFGICIVDRASRFEFHADGKATPHRFQTERHRNVVAFLPQWNLVEHCRAAEPPVLAAEQNKVIAIEIGEIRNVPRCGCKPYRVAAIRRGMCGLQDGLAVSRRGPIQEMKPAPDDREKAREMPKAKPMHIAPNMEIF